MGRSFDELALWTRKLGVNRTHDETEYFMAGYSELKNCSIFDTWKMLHIVQIW